MKPIKRAFQQLFDRYDYVRYKAHIIIGNANYHWCNIPVPIGYPKQSQTHPSIQFFSEKWRGYSYWMATTPYPDEQIEYENPCIYRSNDPIVFSPIDQNPILEHPGGAAYNSDPELFLFEDRLYCIVRENGNSHYLREIKLLNSIDGQIWSKPFTIYTSNEEDRQLLSPSYVRRIDKHLIYFLNGNAGIGRNGKCTGIEIAEADDLNMLFHFSSNGFFLNQEEVRIEPWHFDLFEYKNRLYMVLCARDRSKRTLRNPMYTYLAVSDDYVNFLIYRRPIVRYLKSYRPSAYVDDSGIFHLYFSIIGSFLKDHSDRNVARTSIPFDYLLNIISE
jgi:hypothetical protein